MEQRIMLGKPVADSIKSSLEKKFAGHNITLATVLVGDDMASMVYQGRLEKLAHNLGIKTKTILLPKTITQTEAEQVLEELNAETEVKGILPFMPVPAPLDGKALCAKIAPAKDVDCLTSQRQGEFFFGEKKLAPATPRACLALLKYYNIELSGKRVVVLGRSNVVGKPVAMLLLQENATVTICHSQTKNLPTLTGQADILVVAMGKANFVTPDMVKPGVVIVDVGINAVDGGLVGDVHPATYAKASAYTPVPGGVGVVSNVMIMSALGLNL